MKKFNLFDIGVVMTILTPIIGIIAFIWMGSVFLKDCNNLNNEYKTQIELYVGKKILMDKDSLTIINYNPIAENATLSNGLKVNKKLIDRQLFPTKIN